MRAVRYFSRITEGVAPPVEEKLADGSGDEHHAIYEGIASGDGPRASDTVEAYLRDS